MNVPGLWVLYIIIVLLVWLLLWYPPIGVGMTREAAAFLALLVGALVVFLLSPLINFRFLSKSDRVWLGLLVALAYLLPLVAAVFIFWGGYGMYLGQTMKSGAPTSECQTERLAHCDSDTGFCIPVAQKTICGAYTTMMLYD